MQMDPHKYPDRLGRDPKIIDLPNGIRQKVRDVDGHWIWSGYLSGRAKTPIGYMRGGIDVSVRRYVASLMYGVLDRDMRVRAKCGNPRCVAPQCVGVAFASHWMDTGCAWERREFCVVCGTKIGRESRGWRRCHHCAKESWARLKEKRRSDPAYRRAELARQAEYRRNLSPKARAERNAKNAARMRDLRRRVREAKMATGHCAVSQ